MTALFLADYSHTDTHPTVSFDHIKRHYSVSPLWIDPTGIVALGAEMDFSI